MIYIITNHYFISKNRAKRLGYCNFAQSMEWLLLQFEYFSRNIKKPYRIIASVNRYEEKVKKMPIDKCIFLSHNKENKEFTHGQKLDYLVNTVYEDGCSSDDIFLFFDSDSFPIRPIINFVESSLEKCPIGAIKREEFFKNNLKDRSKNTRIEEHPHPSFCFTTAGFWSKIGGNWNKGPISEFSKSNGPGGELRQILASKGIEFESLTRTNGVNLFGSEYGWYGGIYGDLIYHHGGGSYREVPKFKKLKNKIEKKYKNLAKEKRLIKLWDDIINELKGETHEKLF